jgi:type II secretion system protein D
MLLVIAVAIAAVYFRTRPLSAHAQNTAPPAARQSSRDKITSSSPAKTNQTQVPAAPLATNSAPSKGTNGSAAASSNTQPASANARPATPPGFPGSFPRASQPVGEVEPLGSNDQIQLSFQGANIEMIVQWLAKVTGKSVVKHPRVQCQLTIVSSKKTTAREAINLVYRALALEGFSVIESSGSILIVPEGSEPKMSPRIVDSSAKEIPEGRQRLLKIFTLNHIEPAEIKDKVRPLLSDKGTVEVADRSNQLIVTDYTENIRMAAEFIEALDVPSSSDILVEFYPLKYSEAEDLGNLLSLILNAQPPPPSSSSSPNSGSSNSRPPGMSGPIHFPPGVSPPSVSSHPSSSSSPGSGPQPGAAVKIWPDKTANRLIIAAAKSKHPEIKSLIEVLDTEKPQDVALRVIPLKNVTAEDLVKEIGPLYEKMSGKSLKDVIEIAANNRSNALIVLSSESNFKLIQNLISELDTEDAQEKVFRVYPLKNADAEDVAKQLQDLNQDQDNSNRYPFYIFSSSMANNKGSKKPSIVADRRRNAVMVQASPGAIEGIEKLIKSLDEPVTDNSLTPRIFRLKYVSAVDIEDVLNELFLKKQQQRGYWDYYDSYNPPQTTGNDSGRLFGKVRITSEPYSNSIIVTSNSPESLSAVEDILNQLDAPSQAGETTLRVGLKFAKATTLANNINILFAKGGSPPLRPVNPPQPQQDPRAIQQPNSGMQSSFALEEEEKEDVYYPWLGGQQENQRTLDGRNAARPVSDLVGRVRVVPDKRSNSLLITANVHYFPEVIKLINDMDAPTAQVLIEAKIVEVSGDFRDKLGVRWSPDGSRTFETEDLDNAVGIKNQLDYTKVFGDSLQSGVLNSTVNLDLLIQLLRKNTDSKVLAEPQLNIADNEMGKLFVGSQIPFISGSLNTEVGGRNDTFQYRDVGIILEVTPHVNDAGEVALRIRAESSNVRNGETLFGGAILDTRNFRTDLMIKDGETVVLGGIIQREQTDTERKVPVLGSIPGLGWAFKNRDKVAREVELLVFLKTRIARSPADAAKLLEQVRSKAPLIQKWEDDKNKESAPPRKNLRENQKNESN